MELIASLKDLYIHQDCVYYKELIIIIFHCLTSDTDPMRPTQTTPYTGETYKFTGRKPLICWGRKNPMSHLSRMKNPDLPCPHVAAALRAYGYVLSSLDDSNSLGTTTSFTRTYSPCLINLTAVLLFVSHILAIPCVLSLV